ncbi:LOW QUALITY PROTEIN: hypothetical protein M8C21_015585 [Ambrosia artemisiifolia]|uniref:Uncharacterized protein n=1 Tax=Ambrosia artemisiifolia TaxID=4212 RepID=A0AAD5GQ24_AMBAR|nr:LOW QUALITY PROTEIN: hypothetical protein M8C21_015585 [Ambrosia artemisiifolia]
MTNHHSLGDASTRFAFLKAWTLFSKSCGDELSLTPPIYDRLLDVPKAYENRLKQTRLESFYETPSCDGPSDRVRATFVLARAHINRLKKQVLTQLKSVEYVSSFTVTCGYIWSCMVKSFVKMGELKGEDELEQFIFSVNCRSRLDPPLPASYFGNCAAPCVLTIKNVVLTGENGFVIATKLIGEGLSKLVNNKEGILKDAERWYDDFKLPARKIGVSGTPKFDFYDIDFGWGKPIKYEVVSLYSMGTISIGASKESAGQGLEIGVCFPSMQMEAFANIFNHGLEISFSSLPLSLLTPPHPPTTTEPSTSTTTDLDTAPPLDHCPYPTPLTSIVAKSLTYLQISFDPPFSLRPQPPATTTDPQPLHLLFCLPTPRRACIVADLMLEKKELDVGFIDLFPDLGFEISTRFNGGVGVVVTVDKFWWHYSFRVVSSKTVAVRQRGFLRLDLSHDGFLEQWRCLDLSHGVTEERETEKKRDGEVVFPYSTRKPEIRHVEGDSVALTFIECTLDFNDLTRNHPRKCENFHSLVPSLGNGVKVSEYVTLPVFSVQVTYFPNSGISIGMTNHHSLGDASTRFGFLKAWTSVYDSGGDHAFLTSGSLPVFDRLVDIPKVFEDRLNQTKLENFYQPRTFLGPSDRVRATFVLTRTHINGLKKHVLTKLPSLEYVSSFTVTCGYIWSCMVKSFVKMGEKKGEDELEQFIIAVGCRPRLNPPLPASYFGNCSAPCIVTIKKVVLSGENGFVIAAKLIGEGISKMVNNKEGILKDAARWHDDFKIPARKIGVSGTPKFDFYDIDFGWGKPIKNEVVSIDYSGSVSISACKESAQDLEIGVSFESMQMEVFAKIFNDGLEKCTLDFNDLTGNHPRKCEYFYPLVPPLGSTVKESDYVTLPLFSVQVTYFPNSGISIGMTNHHSLGDANTRFGFLKAWTSVYVSGGDQSFLTNGSPPVYDRFVDIPKLDEIRLKETRLEGFYQPPSLVGPTDRVRATFVLARTHINGLKKHVLTQLPSLEYVSSFTVTCGYLWSCIVKSLVKVGEKKGEDELEQFVIAVDCRSRLDPPLPTTYFGNCSAPCVVSIKHGVLIGESGFVIAAKLIGEGINKMVNNKEGILKDAEKWHDGLKNPARKMSVSGTPKLNFYDTDFGWGKPIKYECVSIDYTGSVAINASEESTQDLEIAMCYPSMQMEAFAKIFNDGLESAIVS